MKVSCLPAIALPLRRGRPMLCALVGLIAFAASITGARAQTLDGALRNQGLAVLVDCDSSLAGSESLVLDWASACKNPTQSSSSWAAGGRLSAIQ